MNWNNETVKKAVELIQGSPLHFIRTVLGEEPYAQQLPILDDVRDHRRTAVKSGHSCGKDWLAARIALWFHVAHYPSIVVTTGPTDRQVENIVWGELTNAYNRATERARAGVPGAIPIGGRLLTQELHSIPRSKDHYMIGYTARDPAAFSGIHSENILIVVTEASGIEPEIWKGINSLMTAKGKARLLVVGNPISDIDSEFYAMFSTKANLYRQHTLSSEDSPYCGKEWIDEVIEEFGIDSPIYNARVKGLFQPDLADTLIPLSWLEKARQRWNEPPTEYWAARAPTRGIDVARFGSDLTAEASIAQGKLKIDKVIQGQDLMRTAGDIVCMVRDDGVEAKNVRIDDTGLGGGVTDRLHEQDITKDVLGINFGSDAEDKVKFKDARSQLAWCLRLAVRDGLAIDPHDNKLLRDMSSLKYKITSDGRIQLESKAETKKRTGHSPDRSDAAKLAAAPPEVAEGIANGDTPFLGLLDYMKQRAATVTGKSQPVSKTALDNVPGVRTLPPGVTDAEARKIEQARQRYGARPPEQGSSFGP